MKQWIATVCVVSAFFSCAKQESMEALTARVFRLAEVQYTQMDTRLDSATMPRTIAPDGSFQPSNIRWWCSGFYPGSLWYIYEYTGSPAIEALARKHTANVEPRKFATDDHDVGFQLNCSFGNGLRLTGEESYKEVLYTGARSLAARFNPTVGCTQSWNLRQNRDWKFPVIVDNMLNLELLMTAAGLYGDDTLGHVARTHANTTMKNHFRDDYTSYHLVDYDPETGAIRSRETVQGLADESAWARGQAWGLYGYAMMYRMTNAPEYLAQGENIARMLIARLPADGIPYWDFDSNEIPGDYRDASAGAIMASAFIELAGQTADASLSVACLETAEKQLRTLASDEYLARPGENADFILKHSVGSLPANSEVDVPLTYADYYFLEALLRFASRN